jgi:hypothetical protein
MVANIVADLERNAAETSDKKYRRFLRDHIRRMKRGDFKMFTLYACECEARLRLGPRVEDKQMFAEMDKILSGLNDGSLYIELNEDGTHFNVGEWSADNALRVLQ